MRGALRQVSAAWVVVWLVVDPHTTEGLAHPPKRIVSPGKKRGTDVEAELLAAAVGRGRGMGAVKTRRTHRSKYASKAPAEDPWTAATRQAEEASKHAATPRWRAVAAVFEAAQGAVYPRRRRRGQMFDGRDPSSFGFAFCGTIVGAHGVRGAVIVDAPDDRETDARIVSGPLHLRLVGRKAPRPVDVVSSRSIRRLGANRRYVLQLSALDDRDVAASLAGAEFFFACSGDDHEEVDDLESFVDLENAPVYDEKSGLIGTVFDVLDPTPQSGLAQRLLQVDLGPAPDASSLDARLHCYVPLAQPVLTHYDPLTNAITIDPPPGLLDLAFVYEPPPPLIRGFLPPGPEVVL